MVKTIAVVSGKGGTGKTSLTASFAALAAKDVVLADCDVDAANLFLLARPTAQESHPFYGGQIPVRQAERCTGCGACRDACRFQALEEDLSWDSFSCEGCGVCRWVCPQGAISMEKELSGQWYLSETAYGTMVHARLEPGRANSGKLVTRVRQAAGELALEERVSTLLVDGPPGMGCPVIASVTGVTGALVVTEPTRAALHDLTRILELLRQLGVKAALVINRWDVHEDNCRAAEKLSRDRGTPVLGRIPYHRDFPRAMSRGLPVVEHNQGTLYRNIRDVWLRVQEYF